MITGDLKSKIDGLWEDFWVGGITNPLTVIEQITYLMYSRMLDTQEQRDEKRKQIAGIDFNRVLHQNSRSSVSVTIAILARMR
uniref:N6 adenine-specific DNA methyltransferase N-terminal domain-containing protein n=1 Tax=Escherichia coli TaxID=562 RepID=A8CFI3_ECOLX|nr:hypothetical protein [Escherichia coli]